MRLGDVDKLLYRKRKVMFFGLGQDDECWGFAVPVEEIDKAPTIDAVPVVRCQECKYKDECIRRIEFIGRNPVLEQNTYEYHPLSFCSYGQRKEAAHDKYPSGPV